MGAPLSRSLEHEGVLKRSDVGEWISKAEAELGKKARVACVARSVTSVEEGAFERFKLTKILVSIELPVVARVGNVFSRPAEKCRAVVSVSLPAAARIGHNQAFEDCEGLTSISLRAATVIGANAFDGCDKLTSVSHPAATKIGEAAPMGCTAPRSVSLPLNAAWGL